VFKQISTTTWFLAFLAALGWGMANGVVGSRTLGRRLWFGVVMFILAEVPRLLLPLPFITQPRIQPVPAWMIALGAVILAGSLYFGTPVFRIAPLTAPNRREPLRTDGLYAVVRHPLMLCDIFWPLGWSMFWGSVIGMVLTPAWLLLVWVLIHVEEESLLREYGEAYRQYQAHVPRLFPRLNIFSRRLHH
jgi:protein-S-isoprenylcysteine O-methyltransferase Ste14